MITLDEFLFSNPNVTWYGAIFLLSSVRFPNNFFELKKLYYFHKNFFYAKFAEPHYPEIIELLHVSLQSMYGKSIDVCSVEKNGATCN